MALSFSASRVLEFTRAHAYIVSPVRRRLIPGTIPGPEARRPRLGEAFCTPLSFSMTGWTDVDPATFRSPTFRCRCTPKRPRPTLRPFSSTICCPCADITDGENPLLSRSPVRSVTSMKGRATLYSPFLTFSTVGAAPSTSTVFILSLSEPMDIYPMAYMFSSTAVTTLSCCRTQALRPPGCRSPCRWPSPR